MYFSYIDYTKGVAFVKACGLIVEYNPFHNGHLYHVTEAKRITNADCMIAVMSGTFLQRGEPAIIDKFHRTRAALLAGVDIVVELPYAYAVQSSHLFAKGAVHTLHALQVDAICFGSESGDITAFYDAAHKINKHKATYDAAVKEYVSQGEPFPLASQKAYEQIGLEEIDLVQPNNILGFSYVRTIVDDHLPIQAFTIKRLQSNFHDTTIKDKIASATSIRRELENHALSQSVVQAIPAATKLQLEAYKQKATLWHDWEKYFPLLHYRVMTMSEAELKTIHGVDEGLEARIKKTALEADSFTTWLERLKTKRYTLTRLQRMFVHILTHTTKAQMQQFLAQSTLPYIRLLGFSDKGQAYLHTAKKHITVPIIANLTKHNTATYLDEKALHAYYAILPSERRIALRKQEFALPIQRNEINLA